MCSGDLHSHKEIMFFFLRYLLFKILDGFILFNAAILLS